MAQVGVPDFDPTPPSSPNKQNFFSRFMRRGPNGSAVPQDAPIDTESEPEAPSRPGMLRRMSKKVIPGLPRAQTFKRQLSEQREHLAPVETSTAERRAISMDRRSRSHLASRNGPGAGNPRSSASVLPSDEPPPVPLIPQNLAASTISGGFVGHFSDYALTDGENARSTDDEQSEYDDNDVTQELETIWILNLSMHYRDRSRREKFFITYRQDAHRSRRVTVSIDYRDAPEGSLEEKLDSLEFQKDKNRKIYEAIRSSLPQIQFYDTVTNLKLETADGQLYVHVVEDGNEIIQYPNVSQVAHLQCPHIPESQIDFDSHVSGFVYLVSVTSQNAKKDLIKKEIPSPEVIEEFLYEIHALQSLAGSAHVIRFYGIVVDNSRKKVKGLLIDYASRGTLIDVILDSFEDRAPINWQAKERWARQIVHGLADIHEAGFVQGDFTMSNIVIDENSNAKIIDINRRGCPVGWEPPELTPLLESGIHIPMYIGVKSDLFQLGMVLYGIAMDIEEPERAKRPLTLDAGLPIPDWYRRVTEICLSTSPQARLPAAELLRMFPPDDDQYSESHRDSDFDQASVSIEEGECVQRFEETDQQENGYPKTYATDPEADLHYLHDDYVRGRSPIRDWRWHHRRGESGEEIDCNGTWANAEDIYPSYSDIGDGEDEPTLQPDFCVPAPSTAPAQLSEPESDFETIEGPTESNFDEDDTTPVAETENRSLEAAVNMEGLDVASCQHIPFDSVQQANDRLDTSTDVGAPATDNITSVLVNDADSASINTTASADTGVTNSDASTRVSDSTESSISTDQAINTRNGLEVTCDAGSIEARSEPMDDVATLQDKEQKLPTQKKESEPERSLAAKHMEVTATDSAPTAPGESDQKVVALEETTSRPHVEGPIEVEDQAQADVKNNMVNGMPDTSSGSAKPYIDAAGSDDVVPLYDTVTTVGKREAPRAATEHEDDLFKMHNDAATHHLLSSEGLPTSNALMTETTA